MLRNTKQSADLQHSKERITSCTLFIRHDSLHVTTSYGLCRSQVPVAFSSHVSNILHSHGQYITFNSTWSFSWAQRCSLCYYTFTNNSLKVCSNRFATKSVKMEQFILEISCKATAHTCRWRSATSSCREWPTPDSALPPPTISLFARVKKRPFCIKKRKISYHTI